MNRQPKIAFCGIEGSFTHSAALSMYGSDSEYIAITPFVRIFDEIEKGNVDVGVIPIENTLAGTLYEHYDALEKNDLCIGGEIVLPIEHHLLVKPGDTLDQLEKVYSHPKALEQCCLFLEEHAYIEAVAVSDTATAADLVRKSKQPVGAIASREAAELNGLENIKPSIADKQQNYTRFICIEKAKEIEPFGDKCSLILTLDHKPGSLCLVLECFKNQGLNLTKIDSRPQKERPFEYLFYIDVEGNISDSFMEKLRDVSLKVKLLGSYNRSLQWTV